MAIEGLEQQKIQNCWDDYRVLELIYYVVKAKIMHYKQHHYQMNCVGDEFQATTLGSGDNIPETNFNEYHGANSNGEQEEGGTNDNIITDYTNSSNNDYNNQNVFSNRTDNYTDNSNNDYVNTNNNGAGR